MSVGNDKIFYVNSFSFVAAYKVKLIIFINPSKPSIIFFIRAGDKPVSAIALIYET